MSIVSVSLDEKSLADLDRIQRTYELNGRSEAVRAAICSAVGEIHDMEDLSGTVEGVLITVKRDHTDPWMSVIQAKHTAAIKTQLHTHLKTHKCLEVMIISCEAGELQDMLREIEAAGKADYIRFVSG